MEAQSLPDSTRVNASVLDSEFEWLEKVIRFQQDPTAEDEITTPEYDYADGESAYLDLVRRHELTPEERLIVLLALASEFAPGLFEQEFAEHKDGWKDDYGCVIPDKFGGLVATVQTALFVLGGGKPKARLQNIHYLVPEYHLFKNDILIISQAVVDGKRMLLPTEDTLHFIQTGQEREPVLSTEFPANRIETLLDWEDLILGSRTKDHLKEILLWLDHGQELQDNWSMEKTVGQGYRTLFYGPPGTGKSLTAALMGKLSGKPVYRIDLSRLVSKYIGETEKNLERVFNRAKDRDWILFFDEADSLFGKRTNVNNSNDRYANQESAYLLQKVEHCPNPVFLASNLKGNIDDAFMRRFQCVVEFPMPAPAERLKLWEQSFSPRCSLAEDVNLPAIAKKYELAGGSIIHVTRFVTLLAIHDKRTVIPQADIIEGINRELRKEGKVL